MLSKAAVKPPGVESGRKTPPPVAAANSVKYALPRMYSAILGRSTNTRAFFNLHTADFSLTDGDSLSVEFRQRKTVERFAVSSRHIAQHADGDLFAEQNRFARVGSPMHARDVSAFGDV